MQHNSGAGEGSHEMRYQSHKQCIDICNVSNSIPCFHLLYSISEESEQESQISEQTFLLLSADGCPGREAGMTLTQIEDWCPGEFFGRESFNQLNGHGLWSQI